MLSKGSAFQLLDPVSEGKRGRVNSGIIMRKKDGMYWVYLHYIRWEGRRGKEIFPSSRKRTGKYRSGVLAEGKTFDPRSFFFMSK